jgi:uncharacterized caspase-like protein
MMTNRVDCVRPRSADADAALVYCSGHAMQFDGSNYLMPVDPLFMIGPIYDA